MDAFIYCWFHLCYKYWDTCNEIAYPCEKLFWRVMTGINIILGIATKDSWSRSTFICYFQRELFSSKWEREFGGCIHLRVVSSLLQTSELQQKSPHTTLICYFQSETFFSRWKREFGGCVHLLMVSSPLQASGHLKWNCIPLWKRFSKGYDWN